MIKALATATVIAALFAGCSSGPKEAGPVPTAKRPQPSASTGSTSAGSTSTSTSTPLCDDDRAAVKVESQQGAAGTIETVWRVTNTSGAACRSLGYPGMDFRAANGWLDVQVQRGGLAVIDEAPAQVVLESGQSLYFASFWGDVDTQEGPCKQFDRIKVTLPDNFTPARIVSSGCVDPDLVRVGPVTSTVPS